MNVWGQIDALKVEHEETNALKGWRFKGRKPNGDWVARHGTGKGAIVVRAPKAAGLLAAVDAMHCPECRHFVSKRVPEVGCRGFRTENGKKTRCGCETCKANAPKVAP